MSEWPLALLPALVGATWCLLMLGAIRLSGRVRQWWNS